MGQIRDAVAACLSEGHVVVGGVAVQKLEAWLLALGGQTGSEALPRPEDVLGLGKDTAAMVAIVDSADLTRIPDDATSLHEWLALAHRFLAATTSPSSP